MNNRSRATIAVTVMLCLFLVGGVRAARPTEELYQLLGESALDDAPAIRLRAATFVPSRGEAPDLLWGDLTLARRSDGRQVMLLQYRGPILPKWRAALTETGVEIMGYIPEFAYKVAVDGAQVMALSRLPGVLWVGPYYAAYALSPELRSSGRQAVRLDLDGPPSDELLTALPQLGALLVGQDGHTLAVEISGYRLAALSRLPGVAWISPLGVPRVFNDVAGQETRANQAWNVGLDGAGQIINIADTGLDTGRDYPQVIGDVHRDVDNRLSHIYSWPMSDLYYQYLMNPLDDDGASDQDSGHGTHVAGSVAGNGYRSQGRYRGVAYRATLTFQALEQYCRFSLAGHGQGYQDGYMLAGIPSDLGELYDQAYDWGARIHNNSWGTDNVGQGVYTTQCQQTDRFVWEHRDTSIVFAVGNEGRDDNHDGFVDYGSILPPATAKNIIAVGATENRRPNLLPYYVYATYGLSFPSDFDTPPLSDDPMGDAGASGMAAFSGRGPVASGRLLPHIVAPGTWIASMRSSRADNPTPDEWLAEDLGSYYMYLGGTSMSAPQVSGALALVRQAYQQRGHAQPSAALLKATLIQSARDISGQYAAPFTEAGPIPNNDEGWGVLDVAAAVALGREFADEEQALRTGEEAILKYRCSTAERPIKFTLVWSDYPAWPDAGAALVNDLDLEVIAPDGTLYRGNAFAGGWSRAGGVADRVNNVECVYLPTARGGRYTVKVRAHNVPQGPQDFALLVDLPPVVNTEQLVLPLVLRNQLGPTLTPTNTPTITPTPTMTLTPSMTPTSLPTVPTVGSPTVTVSPTMTSSPTPSASPTLLQTIPLPTETPTLTVTPKLAATPTPTATHSG